LKWFSTGVVSGREDDNNLQKYMLVGWLVGCCGDINAINDFDTLNKAK
jgi:hypothetical protein